ncbi:Alpha/Beta hydrolase protein [Jimgerdemannia flammicorona]|uniref:Alpha/Beta hydrolase protein n=2 Tax=Jimgerdemannia flammicorona TaxID=994334 RepID=A0A433QGZ0_9FUNG|nr:Alpha/Beta hydrolase protein [Jimgerdemannia flammicorona]RUS29090.1 Alpha/Beta hydrolase protein [Jimgerdemannia flammicorona]
MLDETPVTIRELADPDSQFVRVQGILVHYKLAQPILSPTTPTPSSPKVILLLHGFFSNLNSFSEILQPLADATGHQVIAYDRLGFGLTERPLVFPLDGANYSSNSSDPSAIIRANPWTFPASVHLSFALLDALYITHDVIIVGNSAGGDLATHTYLAYKSRVISLILLSAALSGAPPKILRTISSSAPTLWLIRKFLSKAIPFKKQYYDKRMAKLPAMIEKYRKPLRVPEFWLGFGLVSKYGNVGGITKVIGELTEVDLLLVTGEQDALAPVRQLVSFHAELVALRRQREQKLTTARVELALIPLCGHAAQEEKPVELLDILVPFINRTIV